MAAAATATTAAVTTPSAVRRSYHAGMRHELELAGRARLRWCIEADGEYMRGTRASAGPPVPLNDLTHMRRSGRERKLSPVAGRDARLTQFRIQSPPLLCSERLGSFCDAARGIEPHTKLISKQNQWRHSSVNA
jgi:hypothetical protein